MSTRYDAVWGFVPLWVFLGVGGCLSECRISETSDLSWTQGRDEQANDMAPLGVDYLGVICLHQASIGHHQHDWQADECRLRI